MYFAKTDHQMGAANRVTARYNHQDFTGRGFENSGPFNSLEHTGDSLVSRTLQSRQPQRRRADSTTLCRYGR